jgi:hypothetical protein
MARRNIDKVVKMAAIEEMRQGLPRNEIKERYGVAASTLSRWAQEAGVEGPEPPTAVLRSRPLKKASSPIDSSSVEASSETRRKMLDNMLTLINDLVQGGGLKSHDVKNLGAAAKAISESHQREQQLLREEQAKERPVKKGESDYDSLVSLHPDGTPKNIQALFAMHDVEAARITGDREFEESAKDRVRAACVEAGLSPVNVPFDRMIEVGNKEHNEKYPPAPARVPAEDAEESLEYQGEGLS